MVKEISKHTGLVSAVAINIMCKKNNVPYHHPS